MGGILQQSGLLQDKNLGFRMSDMRKGTYTAT